MFPAEERYIKRIVLKLCIFEDVPTKQGQFQRRMGKKKLADKPGSVLGLLPSPRQSFL